MFNLNKLVAGTSIALAAMTAATAFGASELEDAVAWGYENELTKFNTVDSFMPYATLTREQGAKFFSAFATLNLCKEPDPTASCDFSDLNTADETLADYAVLACQLGLFKGSNGKFMPKAPFLKNEVITVLMRAIDGMQDESVSPWWKNYFIAAKEAGITNEVSAEGLARPVQRYEALLMMYRAKSDDCSKTPDDLQAILDNLFDSVDDETTTNPSTGNTEPAPVAPVSNGTLKCMLSSDTPAGATVPGNVSVNVATYECEATKEAVTLDSLVLARQGISDSNSVKSISLFANDELVSKNKSFNSDATSNISLSPKVTVAAGAKVKFNVVAKFGSGNNQRVKIALTDFTSNGTNDKSALPAVGNQFEIVNVTPATVEVKSVGGIANVRLGQKGVKVAKFEIKNNSADNVDVTVNQITMRDLKSNVDDNLANVMLKNRGNTIATIADPMSKSLTFKLSTPVVVKKGQTETFDVFADIVDGAGEQIDLVINNEVYVLGSDSRYGYGVAVNGTSSYSSQVFTITAGKVTLTKLSNPSRLAREDKDDLVLANLMITSNESKNLTLEDIKFVANTGVSNSSYFENVELKVINGNATSTYSLDAMSGNAYGDTDLSIALPASGSVTLQLIADVVKPLPAGYTGVTFNYSLVASGGLRIIENTDDNVVTDIVPSSITFDTMRFVAATTTLNTRFLSNIDVVKGAGNVEAVRFDLLTDEVAPVRYETIVVGGNAEFNSNRVSVVRLYRGTYPNGVLVKEESQFAGNTVTLDDLNLEVPAKSTQPMYLTIDTVSVTGADIALKINSVTAKDAENNDTLTVNGVPGAYYRNITTTSAGTLTYSINTTDNKTNKAKVVVGGTESSEVAAFELNLTNDSALLKNIELTVSGTSFDAAVSQVMLLSSTGAVVDGFAELIGPNTVQFNNIDLPLAAGTTKFYVKVLAKSIGLNKDAATEPTAPYALKVNSVTVEWNADGSQVAYTAGSNYSHDFFIRAVKISNVSLASVGSSLPAGSSLTKVASITFTADSSSNTSVSGFDIKAKISSLQLNFGGVIASSITGVQLRDNAGNPVATCSITGACTAISPWPLVDQGGSNTFYIWVSTNNSSYTPNNNDTLTIGIANTDNDVSVIASDTNGVDQYGVQIGLFLPNTTSVAAVTITE